ncbi:MAG TPA: hypothetical protein PLP14_03255 [Chitinophagaceae bacterium]|nr:hypothetical protein [Chitinophagaceae bacterium]
MKKVLLSLSFLFLTLGVFAQSEQYKKGMKNMLTKLNEAKNDPAAYEEAANGFNRIAEAEKTQWLPKYYSAFSMVMQAMFSPEKDKVDAILDVADRMLSEISATKESDEVLCLQAFSKSTRISVDPMSRGMKYGTESAKLLAQAKALNPDNPRIYFLQGQSAYYPPEQFGGGKKVAEKLFLTASEKFEKFPPKDELQPSWGKEATVQMLNNMAE